MLISSAVRKAALAAGVAGLTFFAVQTDANAGPSTNCTYYSDDSYTTVVGRFGKDCCNNTVAWGVKTSYSVCSSGCLICYPPPID